jgi:RNHCP domain-containing protein
LRRSRHKFPRFDDESDYRSDYREKSKQRPRYAWHETFKCRRCRQFIGPLPSGGHHRNHCPYCLFSRHVDGEVSGDRMSTCGSSMEPIGSFQRVRGEYVLVHRCLGCGFERFNRIAADDNFELMLTLPTLPPRTRREVKLQRL